MNIYNFIRHNGLREADAIVLRKKFLGMVDHFAVFIGIRQGVPTFVANYNDGVKVIPPNQLGPILKKLEPREIDRFPGNEQQRTLALGRAKSRIGERAYNYITNNCEHFKNWVHFGENRSDQVATVGKVAVGASIGLGMLAIARKNPKTALLGLTILLLGLALGNASKSE